MLCSRYRVTGTRGTFVVVECRLSDRHRRRHPVSQVRELLAQEVWEATLGHCTHALFPILGRAKASLLRALPSNN